MNGTLDTKLILNECKSLPGFGGVFISPKHLLASFDCAARAGLKIVFSPSPQNTWNGDTHIGKTALQDKNDNVLLAMSGTFGHCKMFAELFGFESCADCPMIFRYPRN